MRVVELWRYPVKSMRGERVDAATVHPHGLEGDRLVQVRDASGSPLTARTRPGLLGLAASLGPDGSPLVDGRPWEAEESAAAVLAAAGPGSALAAVNGRDEHYHDTSPLLVATDGMIESFGIDRRRLRPNVVIGGVEGLAERDWEGRTLRAGEVEIHVDHMCERCVMTTFDPDTIEQDPDVLRRINAELGGMAALNCSVARPGRIAVGDPVELL